MEKLIPTKNSDISSEINPTNSKSIKQININE